MRREIRLLIIDHQEHLIGESKKKAILELTARLKDQYGSNGNVDLDQIFIDNGFIVIENDTIATPRTVFSTEIAGPVEPTTAYLPTFGSEKYRRHTKAHELGHALMHKSDYRPHSTKEQEANYFAKQLIGPYCHLKRTVTATDRPKPIGDEKVIQLLTQ